MKEELAKLPNSKIREAFYEYGGKHHHLQGALLHATKITL